MSQTFHDYLSKQLDSKLRNHRVVVFYDPRDEFAPFINELEQLSPGEVTGALPVHSINGRATRLATFDGSFFALKAIVEPICAADKPDHLLVYIPGVERDRQGSVLMELECAGHRYQPQLRRLAINLLRQRYTDGDIDEMLKPEGLSYHDVEGFLAQQGAEKGSSLKLVLGKGPSESLITRWLGAPQLDADIEAKLAQPELFRLIHTRLGLALDEDASLVKARHQTLRYVLVNEFRGDLSGAAPDALNIVLDAGDADQRERIGAVAAQYRQAHGDAYIVFADAIEFEFGLAQAKLDPANLGAIDTFRFEERRLLDYAADLVASGHHAKAMQVVSGRGHSFWIDHPSFLGRLAQWEACRLMAELGAGVDTVRPRLKKASGPASKWVEAYAAEDGWFEVDRAQRALENWVANMEDEPEEALERALGVVRRSHETLLKEMSKGFTQALVESSWSTPGVLHQTQIYPELVEPRAGRVAYFFVDAMRYEMGADLVEQLAGAEEVVLQPAVGVLPSITALGMGALLPGASASYSVVEHKGRLATQIGEHVLPDRAKRMKYVYAVRPDAIGIDLGTLLQKSTTVIRRKLADKQLIVVLSQSIDGLGEMDGGLLARQIMDTVIGNLARAVRKLARLGVEHFIITSDHGHQFSIRKGEDMIMDKPGGDKIDQHRRCWAGRGGKTPVAAARVSGAQLGYQTDLDFIFPRGLAVFRAGGDLAFHHGGCSLQEMVIPVVTLRMPPTEPGGGATGTVTIEGYPTELTNRTFGFRLVHVPDLLRQETISARVVLIGDGEEVGRAGMAPDAEFDRATATVQLSPGKTVSIGMLLTKDQEAGKRVRIVVQDPATDAIIAQSDEIQIGELL